MGAYKALRNGSANMDVLVALGTSAAFFYSLYLTLTSGNAASTMMDHGGTGMAAAAMPTVELYYETSAV